MITDREIIMAIVDNDCLKPSDAIILLEGDGFHRFQKAVDLYKKGLGKKIIFSGAIVQKEYGSYPFEEVKPFILNAGVPEEDLIHEDKSLQTQQQAVEVVKMAMENGWKRLALVASHEHQYRAYLTFLRQVLDLVIRYRSRLPVGKNNPEQRHRTCDQCHQNCITHKHFLLYSLLPIPYSLL